VGQVKTPYGVSISGFKNDLCSLRF